MDARTPEREKTDGQAKAVTRALRTVEDMGLLKGDSTMLVSVKVPPRLFEAAAKKVGTNSTADVITAALAMIVDEDSFGPWLASQWGVLADIDPEILELMET